MKATIRQLLIEQLAQALECANHGQYRDVMILIARAEHSAALAVVRPEMEVEVQR